MKTRVKNEYEEVNLEEAPKCIDLFSGCGGFTLGMAMAGYNVVGHVEFDNGALETYEHNKNTHGFPNSELIGHDITKITDEEILAFKKKHGEIPIIIGGPPCQSFSLAGQRKVDDPRNNLFLHYVRFVKLIQPKGFVLENVMGLTSKKNKEGEFMIDVIRQAFKEIGYETEYALLNAMNYSVPQKRRRIFMVGCKDKNKINFPLPITMDDQEGTEEKITDRSKRIQLKRCPRCNKSYASMVYLEDKSTICVFCHKHEKNIINNELEPCNFKGGQLVVGADVEVPATRYDFVHIRCIETRKTEEGETNFVYSEYDRDGVNYPYWARPSEFRPVVDNDEECDEAEIYIMGNTIGKSIMQHLEDDDDE